MTAQADGWQHAETLAFENDCYSTAKPLIDAAVKKYADAGFRVQIVPQAVRLDVFIVASH